MAETVGGEQDMQDFVRGLFQGSPDLSILTHAIVRKKYLAHVGQETLTKEEKEKLKQLVEKELVQMQVDDPPSSKELLTELQTPIRSGGQKRHLCTSDTSGDEAKSSQEQKKQRTGKEHEVSSDEQDSGIDSKKMPVYRRPRPAGKFPGAHDQGDSGDSEDHSDGSRSSRQSAKKKSREAGGRKATQEHQSRRQRGRSESESEDIKEGQGSDLEEEGQRTESDVEPELKDCKLQKKRAFSKQQKWTGRLGKRRNSKMNEERRRKESESEEENERLQVGKMHAKRTVDWRDEEEKEEDGSQKAEIRTRERTRKVQEESESWEELEDDLEEENRLRRKVTSNKQGRKSVKVEELESNSDNPEDSRMRKKVPKAETRRAGEGKQGHRLESNSEDEEEPERQIGKGGMAKTQRKNVSRKELEGEQGDCKKHCNPEKQQGRHKPKRSVSSSDETEGDTDESKGLRHKKEGIVTFSSEGDESQSEAGEERKGESKTHQAPVSSNESGSEKSEVGDRRKKRMIRQRSKDVSGSEGEKSKSKGRTKSWKESVSEMESEVDSGSELEGKKKHKGQQKKGTPKPRRRRNSKEASENESDEEKGGSSSEENSHSKQRHRGKDREHSGKNEDHPSIQRLKRYIRECGVHRNYKKLLAGCRSRRAQLEALKKELENIGLKGTPSLAKCRALKQKREEAAEVASLDLSNIITTEGRPRRRNVWSLYSKPQESPSSSEESPICRPVTDWSRLRGVISSDGESN
ncbi:HIRA-interacting protein 3 [Tiliqua scincoides]|uniref:HIRA-interacting protein 3 n=1 Tax=Tiliqua scincoides TaxID=71010 RepID=UPI0034631001